MNAFFGRAAGAILSLSLLSAPAAQAQDAYPNKPVKVIVHVARRLVGRAGAGG